MELQNIVNYHWKSSKLLFIVDFICYSYLFDMMQYDIDEYQKKIICDQAREGAIIHERF